MAFNVTWDEDTKRYYETGTRRVVLYPKNSDGYGDGVGWSGVTAISETPSVKRLLCMLTMISMFH